MNSQKGAKPKSPGAPPATGTPPAGAPPLPPGPPLAPGRDLVVSARLVDRASKRPLSGVAYRVVDAKGAVRAAGKTDWQGAVYHEMAEPGDYQVVIA